MIIYINFIPPSFWAFFKKRRYTNNNTLGDDNNDNGILGFEVKMRV